MGYAFCFAKVAREVLQREDAERTSHERRQEGQAHAQYRDHHQERTPLQRGIVAINDQRRIAHVFPPKTGEPIALAQELTLKCSATVSRMPR